MNIPANLGELSPEELSAIEGTLIDVVTAAVAGGELSDESRDAAVQLSAVTAELNRREEVLDLSETIRAEVLAAVREELSADLITQALADDDEVVEVEDEDEDEKKEDEAEEAVEEAPSAAELAANDPIPTPASPAISHRATLVTGVGARDAGSELKTSVELAEVLHEVARGMNDGDSRLIARYDTAPSVQLGNDPEENANLIDQVIREKTSGGAEALVASGGWVTPSEVSYKFFEPESSFGLLDLPSIGVNRGGLRVITGGGPQIGDAITTGAAAYWVWDETTDITPSSTVKTRYKVPAPSWTDVRLAAYGVALDHGNLASRSFPELTARWLRLAPAAHEHEINRIFLTAIASASTAITLTSGFTAGGVAATILGAVEHQAALIRQKYRMTDDAILEAVFPAWIDDAIRADLSRRTGFNGLGTSDGEIESYFTARGIRPQFVYDWQQLPSSTKVWESTLSAATVSFLLYPAGQWVRGTGGTLDLGVHRDSILNQTNDYTALWTEQFLSLMKMGPESRVVTVNVDVNGFTGGHYNPA